jgi:hypothetical protein
MSNQHTAIFCILKVLHKIVIFFSPKTVYFTDDEKSADFRHGRAVQVKINSNHFLQRAANSNYEKLFQSVLIEFNFFFYAFIVLEIPTLID